MQHRILIADDSEQTRSSLKTMLEAEGYAVETTGDGKEALEMLLKTSYSLCLTDLRMPGMDGMKLIEEVRRRQLPVTVIVMTGYGSIDEAVKAMRLGALDFLTKPVDPDHLRIVIERALRERGLQAELAQMREKLNSQFRFQNVLSKSPSMHAIFEMIQNVAGTAATVLVEGETGTGKEQVARAIHLAATGSRKGEFIPVNCAAIPENLLESELFGHEKGSFTGAISQRKGRFELAHNGTIFLDEVGDIPAAMQVKLLRVLQERAFERVGGGSPINVDVRVVAATNRGLGNMVKKGKFREDLYYRLNVVRLELPPLRERTEDIPLLATHFAHKHARSDGPPRPVAPSAMEKLLNYPWPGNIRELENVIERCCVVSRGSAIEAPRPAPRAERPEAERPARLPHRPQEAAARTGGRGAGRPREALHPQGPAADARQRDAHGQDLRPVPPQHLRQAQRIRHQERGVQGEGLNRSLATGRAKASKEKMGAAGQARPFWPPLPGFAGERGWGEGGRGRHVGKASIPQRLPPSPQPSPPGFAGGERGLEGLRPTGSALSIFVPSECFVANPPKARERDMLLLLLFAADWPCWRGLDRSGVSAEAGLLRSWPKDGPKLLWQIDGLGEGYSTPSVARGMIFVMGSEKGDEYVRCLSARDGKTLWSAKVGKVGKNTGPPYPGPRCTPAFDDGRVYALGSDGDLVCLAAKDGKEAWHRHLEKEFQGKRGTWAYCESPLVDGDRLVCMPGGPEAAVLCLDKKTGKPIWKMPLEDGNVAGFSSLVIARAGKKKLYVAFMGAALFGVDAATGKRLWRYRKNVGGVDAMTPVVHDGHVFASAAGNADAGGDALLKLVPTEAGVDAKQVYLKSAMKNFHGGAVRIGESLFGTGRAGLVCLDWKTGEPRWKARGVGQGSVCAAGGMLYVRNASGEVALAEIDDKEYREKGRLRQPSRSRFPTFAHPVVANGVLYLRDAGKLFAYDVARKKP